ncbi:hypothetical protein [Spiroplasma citri]|uniref:hypothetical protein n=1 Tax=Spiroplasma citri TaxID=2133 RepID=UPI00148B341B|nr:hypothetical protein [Spiroplasma citri]QJU61697.1 hypothetical protein HHA36_04485 [Spiroplasma citri]
MKITTTDLLVAENEALVFENEAFKNKLAELKQQQLYKEDFEKFTCFWNCCECEDDGTFYLKDNSKYDKLPSKEEK